MHLDVTDLRDFYARPIGQIARRVLARRIRERWPNVGGLSVIGLGFASPYLGTFRGEARRIGALMPASQGAMIWPRQGDTMSVLVDDERLPLPDNAVDRLLSVHCLEGAERVRPLLREIWRVLAPDGRLLMIVPNRRSMWARRDNTPFGYGRPYSQGQLGKLLADALFTPLSWTYALHMPPIDKRFILRSSQSFERLGARVTPTFGGVIIVEAKKEVMAPIGSGLEVARKVPARGTLVTSDGNRVALRERG
jgi:SAM-dependent methyltransferase